MIIGIGKAKRFKFKSNKISDGSGVCFEPDLGCHIPCSDESGILFGFISFALTIIASLSVLIMTQSFLELADSPFDIGPNIVFTELIIIFVTAASVLMTAGEASFFKTVGAAGLILNAVYILFNIKRAVNGVLYFIYSYSLRLDPSSPILTDRAYETEAADIGAGIALLAFIIALGVSMSCIYRTNFALLYIVTFPFFEMGMFWGWEPPIWTVVGLFLSWIVSLSLTAINHRSGRKGSRNNFSVASYSRTFYLTSPRIKRAFFARAAVCAAAVTLISMTAALVIVSASDNFRPQSFKQLRKDISQGFDTFTQRIAEGDLFSSSEPIGGTNGGKLGRYDSIDFTGKTALRVKTSKFNGLLYLRGYAAEEYSNNCWNASKADKSVIKLFEEDDEIPLDYGYDAVLQNASASSLRRDSITVRYVNADENYIYAPYQSLYSSCENIGDQKYDGYASPENADKKYDLDTVYFSSGSWEKAVSASENSDSGYADEYSEYVMTNSDYYDVPDNIVQLIDLILDYSGARYCSLNEYEDTIRSYFKSIGFEYSLSPGVTPSDEDFIGYFLTEQQEGYCVYYASVCVMLMRRLGYPARYVEGYVIDPSQFSSEDEFIRVADRCAHAWCEIFIEGYGWYPVDITPGYQSSNPNLTDSDRADSKDDASSDKDVSSRDEKTAESSAPTKTTASSAQNNGGSDTDKHSSGSDGGSPNSEDPNGSGDNGDSNYAADADGRGISGGEASGGDSSGQNFDLFSPENLYAAAILLFLAASVAAVRIRRRRILRNNKRRITAQDNSSSIIECYEQYLRCIEVYGIDMSGNISDISRSKRIAAQMSELDPDLSKLAEPFLMLARNAVAARMSERSFTKEDAAFARKTLSEMKKLVYEKLGRAKRFSAKWIFSIY